MNDPPTVDHEEPAVTIRRLEAEVARLRAQLEEQELGDRLREISTTAATIALLAAPTSHDELLELIVDTAISVISARAGSLLLVDEEQRELVFEVAVGGKAEQLRPVRIPLGHGIAGGVALSGQPLAVSDVQRDTRWAADVGERVGYTPQSLLCVPLFFEDRVIGALELLDKKGSPSFSADDIETLSLFANQAAVAITQSRTQRNIGALITAVVAGADRGVDPDNDDLRRHLRQFSGVLELDPVFLRSLQLARLVREIAREGEDEVAACEAILRGFADYMRARRRLLAGAS